MYYKIKKTHKTGKFVVTRRKYRYNWFRFEVEANRVLQFGPALLVFDNQKYSLFLTSDTNPNEPTFITADITQYRVFRNSTECILALKIDNFWTFLVPNSFWYSIDNEKIRVGRIANLPKIFIADNDLPAYFKKGFKDTQLFIFHANEKDYLIKPIDFDVTSIVSQIKITEFAEVTPLPPKGYFKAIDEKGEYLYSLHSHYLFVKVEEFAEDDYPEEFKGCYGYWGKNAEGNILGLDITDANGNCLCLLSFHERPAKSVHFYSRIPKNVGGYYHIWQVIYTDGQKQLKLELPDTIDINEDAWNF